MNLKSIRNRNTHYEELLKEKGFQKQNNVYWRVCNDSIFQSIHMKKNRYKKVDVMVTIFSLDMYDTCLNKNIRDMTEDDWERGEINLCDYFEKSDELDVLNCSKREQEDAMIKATIALLEQADTMDRAYEFYRKIYDAEDEEIDDFTGESEPEIQDDNQYWLGLFSEKYDKCKEYRQFEYHLQCALLREDLQSGIRYSEKESIMDLADASNRWCLNRDLENFAQNENEKFKGECAENRIRHWKCLKNEWNDNESLQEDADLPTTCQKKIQDENFEKCENLFWRFYGEEEIQMIRVQDKTGENLMIGTYPLYAGNFLKDIIQNEEDIFENAGIWNMDEMYEIMHGEKGSTEQIIDYALQSLNRADTAEHAYELWTEFLNAKEYTKIHDYESGLEWPECVASPMAYYMIKAGNYEKLKAFVDFWQEDLEEERYNQFLQDYLEISSIYEHALSGDTEFAKQCLEKNYRENREICEETLESDF